MLHEEKFSTAFDTHGFIMNGMLDSLREMKQVDEDREYENYRESLSR